MNGSKPGPVPAPGGLDTSRPNIARIYDFMLGGKDNFAADRTAAEAVVRHLPHAPRACHQNRDFIGRVVHALTDAGIRQFLDIGSGLPVQGTAHKNVHEVAQAAAADSRVVYVDYDPVVVGHARVLLAKGTCGVMVVEADLRDPGKIIGEAQGLFDFSKPVAVLLFAVLHHLTDGDQPDEVIRALTEPLAPGSALALSHITAEAVSPEASQATQQVYQGASVPVVPRSREGIAGFFDGLELMDPGLVDINLWPTKAAVPGAPLTFYGGAARKP